MKRLLTALLPILSDLTAGRPVADHRWSALPEPGDILAQNGVTLAE